MPALSNYFGFLAHNIGKDLRLPEMNVSENLGFNPVRTAKASEPVNVTTNTPLIQSAIRNNAANVPAVNSPNNVLGRGVTGGGNAAAPVSSTPPGNDIRGADVQNQLNAGNNIIDRDFELALNELSVQEQGLYRQADQSKGEITSQGNRARNVLQEQRDTNLAGVSREEQTAQKQADSGLQLARDLFRQLTQTNIANLSAAGLSSSSVAEALAERLGIETARRIAGITGSRDEILQNAAQEKTRIEKVFGQKKLEIEGMITQEIGKVQQVLMQGLDTINNARRAAAVDKANARERLLADAQSRVAELQAQAQEWNYELQQAAAKRQAALDESINLFTATPQDFSNLTKNINAIAPALQGTGLDFGIDVNKRGEMGIQFSSPKREEDEDLEALLGEI